MFPFAPERKRPGSSCPGVPDLGLWNPCIQIPSPGFPEMAAGCPLVTFTGKTDDPCQIVTNVSSRQTRIIALIVVIGILVIRLKSFNREVERDSLPDDDIDKNDTEDWERRASCAKNMPEPIVVDTVAARSVCSTVQGQNVSEPHSTSAPAYTDHTKLMVVRDGRGRELPVTHAGRLVRPPRPHPVALSGNRRTTTRRRA